MRYTKPLLAIAAAFMFFIALASRNNAGIISGTVRDAQTKKPLTDAVVTANSDVFLGQKLALSNSEGQYIFNNLPAGKYVIGFEMEGYKKYMHDSIMLQNEMTVDISFDMEKEK